MAKRWKLCWSRERTCTGGKFKRPRKKTWKLIEDKRQKKVRD